MQMLISSLLLAVLLPAPDRSPEPTCRAQLHGAVLTTSVQFQSGIELQAPWRVVKTRLDWEASEKGTMVVDLSLERIDELDDLTGERKATRLASPVLVTVEGTTQAEVVYAAAQTWCNTVIKVRGEQAAGRASTLMKPGHIT